MCLCSYLIEFAIFISLGISDPIYQDPGKAPLRYWSSSQGTINKTHQSYIAVFLSISVSHGHTNQ